jgi:hypothetical protein
MRKLARVFAPGAERKVLDAYGENRQANGKRNRLGFG